MNFKNLELSKIIEGFNRKFDITTNDLEEKQKNQMEIYNKNLLNIKKVLSSTKSVIIHLKEEKERIHSEFKFLNDNYQALNCKYIQILKLNKELNHKIEIMNVTNIFYYFLIII